MRHENGLGLRPSWPMRSYIVRAMSVALRWASGIAQEQAYPNNGPAGEACPREPFGIDSRLGEVCPTPILLRRRTSADLKTARLARSRMSCRGSAYGAGPSRLAGGAHAPPSRR